VVLIGALWVMAFLALIVVSFVASQEVELKVVGGFADRIQAQHLAASGIEHAKAALVADETPYDGPLEEWRQNPEQFERVPVGDGFYSLIYNNVDENSELAYGMDDENGKINVNTAPLEVLTKLPGMSDPLAEALLDWRDEDDEVTGEGGAESDTYMRLDPPYEAKNGPLDTIEELLMVQGFTPAILYGEDANRNGILDPNEDDGAESLPLDDQDGELDPGLVDLLTVYSYSLNQTLEGQQRININEADQNQLNQRLGEHLPPAKIAWIANYRKARIGGEPIFPDEKYVTPVNVVSPIPIPGVQGQPLTFEDYKRIADLVSVTSDEKVEGKLNINTARKGVLLTLPQISEEEVDALIDERGKEETDLASPTWVYGVLTGTPEEKLAKYTALEPFIDTRSWQFTIQSVGVVPGRGATARLVAVVDRAASPPQCLYWKDITGLGAAFAPPTREEWDQEAGEGR
jgi:type II secretory pathway component PulK